MKCKICNKEYNMQSGHFSKHLKNDHSITRQEYYYIFNNNTECVICSDNKEVINWSYDLLDTCSRKECKETNRRYKISKSQKEKAKNGTHQFQDKELRKKLSSNLKEKASKGEHPFQDAFTREKAINNMRKTFILTNPMKTDELRMKLSKAHKGKKLSKEHKEKISKSMINFLNGLSDEDFNARMRNTDYHQTPIDILLKRTSKHSFEDETDYSEVDWSKLEEVFFGTNKLQQYSIYELLPTGR